MSIYDYENNPVMLERGIDNIGYMIKLLNDNLGNLIDEQMKDFDLTAAQWYPIVTIGLGQGDTPAELARLIEVDTGAMTRMLDRLEAKNFLYRTRCEKDRRVVKLCLTEKGQAVTDKLFPACSNALNAMLKGITQEEFKLFQGLLIRMLLNIRPDLLEMLQAKRGERKVNSVINNK
ncbi:MAG: MarR family transcriptional regulator [Pelistega sp.]|nr:MarR family transcriptional regulator [Pelistega sp.]